MDTETKPATSPCEEATAAPGGAATPPTADLPSTICVVDTGGDGRSDRESWLDLIAVRNDVPERDLAGRIHQLYRDVGHSLYAASKSDHPGVITANVRSAINGLKSMAYLIVVLDRHRHGNVQKITVQYGEDAPAAMEPTAAETTLSKSDGLIEELFLSHVQVMDDLAGRCRKVAKILSTTPAEELLRIGHGRRIGPDRRNWETKFWNLSNYLTGQVTKFTQTMETRRTRGHQFIQVNFVGAVPASKMKKAKAKSVGGKVGLADTKLPNAPMTSSFQPTAIENGEGLHGPN